MSIVHNTLLVVNAKVFDTERKTGDLCLVARMLVCMRRIALIGCVLSVTLLAACTPRVQADLTRRATASSSASSAPFFTAKFRIPILVYHHIRPIEKKWSKNSWSYKMSASPAGFDKQMQWLEDHGYTTIDLSTFVAIGQGKAPGPRKPVVITFDDNNLTQYTAALPSLLAHHQIAVFYIITNRLSNHSFIDADRVKDLAARGMDIESHTVSHASLSLLPIEKMDAELTQSKQTLEALTGKPVLHVAYPSVMQNRTVRQQAAKAGYVTGTIMDPRYATDKDDPFKLPRIEMLETTDMEKILP